MKLKCTFQQFKFSSCITAHLSKAWAKDSVAGVWRGPALRWKISSNVLANMFQGFNWKQWAIFTRVFLSCAVFSELNTARFPMPVYSLMWAKHCIAAKHSCFQICPSFITNMKNQHGGRHYYITKSTDENVCLKGGRWQSFATHTRQGKTNHIMDCNSLYFKQKTQELILMHPETIDIALTICMTGITKLCNAKIGRYLCSRNTQML